MSWALLAVVKVLILAGGGEPSINYNSHAEHVRSLTAALAERGIPKSAITIFWADGTRKGPDRIVVTEPTVPEAWLIAGTELDEATRIEGQLRNTRFEGFEVKPAKQAALTTWFARNGPQMAEGDSLLIAVTDHGEPDPEGAWDTRITLWGESLGAKAFYEALAPVPESVRVVLWMSQCYSGGFAELWRLRPQLCGAFSANPDRVAYGCYPELAQRKDVGHFARMVGALGVEGNIAAASDRVLYSDRTPDTPHLSSDVLLYEHLGQVAEKRGLSLERFVDARLHAALPEAPEWALAARIAMRFGLGALPNYSSTMRLLDALDRDRYALDTWRDRWTVALEAARKQLAKKTFRKLPRARSDRGKRKARRKAIQLVQARLAKRPGLEARLRRLEKAAARLESLRARLDVQEAAAIRVAYLYARLAGQAALDGPAAARHQALVQCERASLWPATEVLAEATPSAIFPPASSLASEIEALRPSYFGLGYKDLEAGVELRSVVRGGPGVAAGLRPGDRLLSVGGWALERPGDFRESALLARPGQAQAVALSRGGESHPVKLVAAPAPLPPRPPLEGEVVPELQLEALDPNAVLVQPAEGQQLLLFFWATWCKPCKKAIGPLRAWAEARDVAVVAVTREEGGVVRKWLKKRRNKGFPFPIALDPERESTRLFYVERTPTFVHIDASGRLAQRAEGFRKKLPLR